MVNDRIQSDPEFALIGRFDDKKDAGIFELDALTKQRTQCSGAV